MPAKGREAGPGRGPIPSPRADAAGKTDEPLVSPGIGVREWLESAVLLPMWHNQTYKGFYIASDAWTNMQPITFFTSSSITSAVLSL